MRVVFTLVCVGLIVAVAAALVVIDLIIKLLPLLIVVLGACVAVRILRRRRPAGGSPPPLGAVGAAPITAVFLRPSEDADADAARRARMVNDGRRPPYSATRWPDPPVIDAEVIDVEVIGEGDHHG